MKRSIATPDIKNTAPIAFCEGQSHKRWTINEEMTEYRNTKAATSQYDPTKNARISGWT